MLNTLFLKTRKTMLRSLTALAVSVCAVPAFADTLPQSCVNALESQSIGLIVPNRAGGGYDTYGRAIANELGDLIGTRIHVSNVVGGGGLMAMSQVANQTEDEILLIVDGVEEIVNSTDGNDILPFGSNAFEMLGIFYTEQEVWLANPEIDFSDPSLSQLVFSTSSIDSNFVPLVIAAKALGFSFEVIGGYGGSGEAIAAVLRGETDLTTASLTTTMRAAENNNDDLALAMIVSDEPVAAAPSIRPMIGPNSIFDARSANWTEEERNDRKELAETVLALGTTRRAIFTASSVAPDILTCMRTAVDHVLSSDALADTLILQGRSVAPLPSLVSQEIFSRVQTTFDRHAEQIAEMREEFGN